VGPDGLAGDAHRSGAGVAAPGRRVGRVGRRSPDGDASARGRTARARPSRPPRSSRTRRSSKMIGRSERWHGDRGGRGWRPARTGRRRPAIVRSAWTDVALRGRVPGRGEPQEPRGLPFGPWCPPILIDRGAAGATTARAGDTFQRPLSCRSRRSRRPIRTSVAWSKAMLGPTGADHPCCAHRRSDRRVSRRGWLRRSSGSRSRGRRGRGTGHRWPTRRR